MSESPFKSCEISQDTYLIGKKVLVVQFIFSCQSETVEVQLGKKWVLCPVWFCVSLYFKSLSVPDIPGLPWCYGICHCLLISIAFMDFSVLQPSLPFLHGGFFYFSYLLCLDKWKTIGDFSGL